MIMLKFLLKTKTRFYAKNDEELEKVANNRDEVKCVDIWASNESNSSNEFIEGVDYKSDCNNIRY